MINRLNLIFISTIINYIASFNLSETCSFVKKVGINLYNWKINKNFAKDLYEKLAFHYYKWNVYLL